MPPHFGPSRTVLVVGTGLIGTSIGLALAESGVEAWLEDADQSACERAISRHAGIALTEHAEPQLVVVAVPPDAVPAVAAEQLVRYPEATVTDVASVKVHPLSRLSEISDQLDRFVGGHPMAGLEVSGPDAGRADLFQDRLWAITPISGTDEKRIADVEWLAAACGAVAIELDPYRHDRAVALTSHTPQLLSSVLAGQLVDVDPQDVALSGQGLRDVTRLADSSPGLWSEILAGNSTEVAGVLRRINDEITALIRALDSERVNVDAVAHVLMQGNEGRRALPDKHGGEADTYEAVPVVIEDKPGELARLFAAAGDAGVNLEDVRIEHTIGRMRAIVELDVHPEVAPKLRSALGSSGWVLRG